MLEQRDVGLGALQSIFRLTNFAGGGSAFLLQTAQSLEIALGHIARAVGLDQLRIQGEDFFLRAAGLRAQTGRPARP